MRACLRGDFAVLSKQQCVRIDAAPLAIVFVDRYGNNSERAGRQLLSEPVSHRSEN
jgi:hypothetical protein